MSRGRRGPPAPGRVRGGAPQALRPLVVAGTDPTGAAGLAADVKVMARYGLSAAIVPTAITVQRAGAAEAVHVLAARLVAGQLRAVADEDGIAVVKVGMLGSGAVAAALARWLARLGRDVPVVLDPVLVSSSGRRLLPARDVGVLVAELLPRAALVTPNHDEAAELTGATAASVRRDPRAALAGLLALGPGAVLLKGGHGRGARSVDLLATRGAAEARRAAPLVVTELDAARVPDRRSVRGTGCALAAAIAALLARGLEPEAAVRRAKADLTAAIAGARRLGTGRHRELDWSAFGP